MSDEFSKFINHYMKNREEKKAYEKDIFITSNVLFK